MKHKKRPYIKEEPKEKKYNFKFCFNKNCHACKRRKECDANEFK
nr:MAG TPA: hypothetical protein [Crassvirales sp.]